MPLILLVIGFVLIIYNYRAIKKENKINNENDGEKISFQSVLQDSKEELNDYKMEIGLLRKDIAESITELQKEIIEIKNNLDKPKLNGKRNENKETLENDYFLDEDYIDKNDIINDLENLNKTDNDSLFNLPIKDEVISEIDFSDKINSKKTNNIKDLLKKGLTEEEICRELSVSKGEVLLVKGLFKK